MFFRKKHYLDWPEYMDRISKIDGLLFMSKTSIKSINNYWDKEERR